MRSRLVVLACIAAVLMLLLPAAAGAAPPAETNKNGGNVELACGESTVTIWVNFVASDLAGGGVPAHVVSGTDSRVFKVKSFSIAGETLELRFPAPDPPFTLVECTHPSPWGEVTLVGAFIP